MDAGIWKTRLMHGRKQDWVVQKFEITSGLTWLRQSLLFSSSLKKTKEGFARRVVFVCLKWLLQETIRNNDF